MRIRTRLLLGVVVLAALFLLRWLDQKNIFPAHTKSEIHRLKAMAVVTGCKSCSGQRPAQGIPHQAGFKK